ncbi:MAG: hypothetical protein ABIJ57_00515 [Pseudomonadota bacterium]
MTDERRLELRDEARRVIRFSEGEITDSEADEALAGQTIEEILTSIDSPPVVIYWGLYTDEELGFIL